jgi:hypothetical protein
MSGQASQRRSDNSESTKKAQSADTVQCYECRGFCHNARDCANRSQKRVNNRVAWDNGNKTGQDKASVSTPREMVKGEVKRRGNKQ